MYLFRHFSIIINLSTLDEGSEIVKPDLKQRRLDLKLTLEEVGDMVGVGKSTVRKWETGDIENMKRDKIVKLAKALKVSPAYVMGMEEEPAKIVPIKSATVPVLTKVSAGLPMYAEENIIEYSQVPSFLYKEGAEQFYLKVSGDSMDQKFKEGDLVFVEKDKPIENGQIGVIMINGYDATVKRVRYDNDKIYLIPESNNPEHLTQVYTKDDEVRFIGRVTSSQQFH